MIAKPDSLWLNYTPGLRALRRWVSTHPHLYIPLRRLRNASTVVTRDTDLLIEGFPRSGNTWTEALIREAGNDKLLLAHHSHAAAHVKQAMKIGVPSIILYRKPDDAVASLLALYENRIEPQTGFVEYIQFYAATLSLRGPLVRFYSFEDVTERAGETVADIAQAFNLPLHAEGLSEGAVFARMDEKAGRLKRRNVALSKSRPGVNPNLSDDRRTKAEAAVRSEAAAQVRAEAHRIYGALTSDLGPAS